MRSIAGWSKCSASLYPWGRNSVKTKQRNCVTPRLWNTIGAEEFLTIPRRFSRSSRQAAPRCFIVYGRPRLLSSIIPSLRFVLSLLFFPSSFYYGWRTFDFIFARGYTARSYFQTRSRFLSRFLCLSRISARTRHLYNQRCVHYDERERERERKRVERTLRRRGKRRRRKEIYFYDRDGDVLFLHDRIFFLFFWRTSDRKEEREGGREREREREGRERGRTKSRN